MNTLRTEPSYGQTPLRMWRGSDVSSLVLVDGTYLSHCQKYASFEPVNLVKRVCPGAIVLYYSYKNLFAPTPLSLVSEGIFPTVN
jgi:hypothetical protein